MSNPDVVIIALLPEPSEESGMVEATKESTWAEIMDHINLVQEREPGWLSISIVHIEDFPRIMDGVTSIGQKPLGGEMSRDS